MRLHTYTVKESFLIQVLAHIVNAVALVIPVLVIVVVVEITACRSVFPCVGESLFNERIVPVNLDPRGSSAGNVVVTRNSCAAVICCTAAVIAHAFVAYIICVQVEVGILGLDSGKHIFDVAFHALIHYA